MSDLKEIIAANITKLRKSKKMTQVQFSNELNYSDKAVSKWERAESIPDIIVLKQIADFFGVTVDFLLNEHDENEELPKTTEQKSTINKLPLTLLSVSPVWAIACLIFTLIALFKNLYIWPVFYVCVPITLLLFIIFNSIWGNRKRNYFIISAFIWSILICLYIIFINYNNIWQIFILGIPAQIIIWLWSRLKKR